MKNLTSNILIKTISLLISIFLWIAIMNTINPMVNGFINVPIQIENEDYVTDQSKTYSMDGPRNIRLSYKVNSNISSNIKQSDFKAYIDLNDLSYTNDLEVRVNYFNNIDTYISNIHYDPTTIHVTINDIVRNEFRVQYDIKGNVGPGHSIGSVILSPNIVYVAGDESIIENVEYVSIDIPVENNDETFSGVSKIKLYGKDKSIISNEGLSFSSDEVGYSVVVYSRSNITLNAVVEGNVKNGYTYAGAQVYPSNIMIDGPRSIISDIYTIDLPVINIDGLSSNQEYRFQISDILPIGINSNTNEVIVNITINDNVLNRPRNEDDIGPHKEEIETTVTVDESLENSSEE